MNLEDFRSKCNTALNAMYQNAKGTNELAFVFSILGIDSGAEAPGWQPFVETQSFISDILWLINSPLNNDTKTRMGLILYCHIVESNYMYHVFYNLLNTIKGKEPKVFNFLDLYTGSKPPSVSKKLKEIKTVAQSVQLNSISELLTDVFFFDIRNAFMHSDYILYNSEFRLKHKGSRIFGIGYNELWGIIKKSVTLYDEFLSCQRQYLTSFPVGYKITNRKSSQGYSVCDVELLVDETTGYLKGFSTSDPLPLW